MMIRLGKNDVVNAMHIVHAKVDEYGDTRLVVKLVTGETIHVRHTPHCFDGFDAYKALEQIRAAQAE